MASNVLKQILDRPIAYHRSFARLGCGVAGAVFLSQAFYWHNRTGENEGWFYKTARDWHDETGLSRRELQDARKFWKELGILEEQLRGMPATLHFRVNVDVLLSSLHTLCKQDCTGRANKFAQGEQTSLHTSSKRVRTPRANSHIQRLPETTTESSASDDAVPSLITKKGRKLTGWKLVAFLRFWECFDLKKGKAEAADAWLDIKGLDDDLVDRICCAAVVESGERPALISRGSTPKWAQGWLTARRWDDEAYQKSAKPTSSKAAPVDDKNAERRHLERLNALLAERGKPTIPVPEATT